MSEFSELAKGPEFTFHTQIQPHSTPKPDRDLITLESFHSPNGDNRVSMRSVTPQSTSQKRSIAHSTAPKPNPNREEDESDENGSNGGYGIDTDDGYGDEDSNEGYEECNHDVTGTVKDEGYEGDRDATSTVDDDSNTSQKAISTLPPTFQALVTSALGDKVRNKQPRQNTLLNFFKPATPSEIKEQRRRNFKILKSVGEKTAMNEQNQQLEERGHQQELATNRQRRFQEREKEKKIAAGEPVDRRWKWVPVISSMIEQAARKAIMPWHPNKITRAAKLISPYIFERLTLLVVGRWIDGKAKVQGIYRWRDSVLKNVK
ncbi:hypothetical protein K435DRAFT_860209 [Dendrothele bispora CBS 962.96]|uniref:Uncharacterized protein n=1 Tax=Dendrothele bispora (strain CBS 962.96) TaxID=1314807 RepID=A0A4S8LYD6_DENBC|nr:hypothetical protein K435DRAFT_860209 [Dendrothele bispora CBS 962.96]